jgi:hypothetical protein
MTPSPRSLDALHLLRLERDGLVDKEDHCLDRVVGRGAAVEQMLIDVQHAGAAARTDPPQRSGASPPFPWEDLYVSLEAHFAKLLSASPNVRANWITLLRSSGLSSLIMASMMSAPSRVAMKVANRDTVGDDSLSPMK